MSETAVPYRLEPEPPTWTLGCGCTTTTERARATAHLAATLHQSLEVFPRAVEDRLLAWATREHAELGLGDLDVAWRLGFRFGLGDLVWALTHPCRHDDNGGWAADA